MLKYDRIDVFVGIDVNKTDGLCECIIWHYWYFFAIDFRFQSKACNGCQTLMQKAKSFNVATVSVKGNDHRIHFWYMTRYEAINIMKNSDFKEKSGLL